MALVPEHDIWRYLCTDYRARRAAAWVAWTFGLRIKLWKLTEYRRIVYLVPCRSPVQTWSWTWQFHTISYNFCVTAWFSLPREQLNAKTESDCVCVIYCDLHTCHTCLQDADTLVHRPIDELFALPESHSNKLRHGRTTLNKALGSMSHHLTCPWLNGRNINIYI
jgi:hypothetical protein